MAVDRRFALLQHTHGLHSASVSSAGVGTGLSNGWSAAKDSTGVYTVTHNLGVDTYSVVVTPVGAVRRSYSVSSKGADSFTVSIYDEATAAVADTAFDFILQE